MANCLFATSMIDVLCKFYFMKMYLTFFCYYYWKNRWAFFCEKFILFCCVNSFCDLDSRCCNTVGTNVCQNWFSKRPPSQPIYDSQLQWFRRPENRFWTRGIDDTSERFEILKKEHIIKLLLFFTIWSLFLLDHCLNMFY